MARRGIEVQPQGDVFGEMKRQVGVPDRLDLADSRAREPKGFVPADEIVDPETMDRENDLVGALDSHQAGLASDRKRFAGKKIVTEMEPGVRRRRTIQSAQAEDAKRLQQVRAALDLEPTTLVSSGKSRLTKKQLGGEDEQGENHRIHGRTIEKTNYERMENKRSERAKRRRPGGKETVGKGTLRERKRDQPGKERGSSYTLQVEREEQKSGLPISDGAVDQIPRMVEMPRSEPLGPVKPKEVFVVKKPRLTGEEIGEMFEQELDRKDNRGSSGRYSSFTSSRSDHRDFARMRRRSTNDSKKENKRGKRDNDGHAKSGRETPRSKSDKIRLIHRVRKWLSGGKDEQQPTG